MPTGRTRRVEHGILSNRPNTLHTSSIGMTGLSGIMFLRSRMRASRGSLRISDMPCSVMISSPIVLEYSLYTVPGRTRPVLKQRNGMYSVMSATSRGGWEDRETSTSEEGGGERGLRTEILGSRGGAPYRGDGGYSILASLQLKQHIQTGAAQHIVHHPGVFNKMERNAKTDGQLPQGYGERGHENDKQSALPSPGRKHSHRRHLHLPARCTADARDIHTGVSVFRFVWGSNTIYKYAGAEPKKAGCTRERRTEWGSRRMGDGRGAAGAAARNSHS